MRDDGTWHDEIRKHALNNKKVLAEYENFKLEFEIAEQLKSMRKKMHITQEVVAARMHSSKSAVSRLELVKGNKHSPSIATIRKYAEAIDCHLEIKILPNL